MMVFRTPTRGLAFVAIVAVVTLAAGAAGAAAPAPFPMPLDSGTKYVAELADARAELAKAQPEVGRVQQRQQTLQGQYDALTAQLAALDAQEKAAAVQVQAARDRIASSAAKQYVRGGRDPGQRGDGGRAQRQRHARPRAQPAHPREVGHARGRPVQRGWTLRTPRSSRR